MHVVHILYPPLPLFQVFVHVIGWCFSACRAAILAAARLDFHLGYFRGRLHQVRRWFHRWRRQGCLLVARFGPASRPATQSALPPGKGGIRVQWPLRELEPVALDKNTLSGELIEGLVLGLGLLAQITRSHHPYSVGYKETSLEKSAANVKRRQQGQVCKRATGRAL